MHRCERLVSVHVYLSVFSCNGQSSAVLDSNQLNLSVQVSAKQYRSVFRAVPVTHRLALLVLAPVQDGPVDLSGVPLGQKGCLTLSVQELEDLSEKRDVTRLHRTGHMLH